MTAIYKKEFRSYFNNMTGYIFVALLLVLVGVYTAAYCLINSSIYFEYALGSVGFIFAILVPIITMRSLSEERRQKTDQLLMTAPVSVTGIILGKFFAMVTVLAIPVGVMCVYPLILSQFGKIPWTSTYSSILAFFLMGAAFIAIGLFISALTENQIIAAVLSFGVLMLSYLMSGISNLLTGSALTSLITFLVIILLFGVFFFAMTGDRYLSLIVVVCLAIVVILLYMITPSLFSGALVAIMTGLSIFTHLDVFTYGHLFDVTSLVYFLSVIFLFLFFSIQAVEKRRWS